MSSPAHADPVLALVHEGWNHLMSQRPQAAWGTWQRALRLDPENAAATEALATLASAHELPLAARKVYRFLHPDDEVRRSRWDEAFRRVDDATELATAAEVFGDLIEDDPDDVQAWYNRGLCMAWQGLDVEAIECLERVVLLEGDGDRTVACESWALAEVLRQGGGSERLADDLRYASSFAWSDEATPRLLDLFPEIRRIETPRDPTSTSGPATDVQVLEWLDRPFPAPPAEPRRASDLPRVLATLILTPGEIRLSSPRVDTLEQAEERLRQLIGPDAQPLERVAAPLPLPFLDADIWTSRLPVGTGREAAGRLTREVVEDYYENQWIHRPRQGLDGLSPLAAAQAASRGDVSARARLEGLVLLREQLGMRPSAVSLYQGYPFDRLRRRLGLDPRNPAALEPADLSCASLAELRALGPEDLEDVRLVEAFASAAGLRDDDLAAPLAAELIRRGEESQGLHPDLEVRSVFAPLVRKSIHDDDPDSALQWLEHVPASADDRDRRILAIWKAEILARSHRPEEASEVYRSLVDRTAEGARLALDAALTLLDNDHLGEAQAWLELAIDVGRESRLDGIERQARRLLADVLQDHERASA